MQKLKTAKQFLKFYTSAKTKYQIHSPFVYDFVQEVLEDDRNFYAFFALEILREQMLKDNNKINVIDFGAGSKLINNPNTSPDQALTRSISSIANSALSGPRQCRNIFRLVNKFKPKTILEIGTSLGLSTLYHFSAAINAKIITLEGCPEIARLAKANFKNLEASTIEIIQGEFNKTLPKALERFDSLDYVFIDGNHRLAPTLSYFEQCLSLAHKKSIFVIDDIYWSDEMQKAWQKIKHHPKVQLSIDLYDMGIVFFRNENKEKEHFKLIKTSWRPWSTGFFG